MRGPPVSEFIEMEILCHHTGGPLHRTEKQEHLFDKPSYENSKYNSSPMRGIGEFTK